VQTNNERGFASANVRDWFEKRSYGYEEFGDVKELVRRKRELGLTVSLVLPGRNVADTIGGIVNEVKMLNEQAPRRADPRSRRRLRRRHRRGCHQERR